MVGRTKKVDLLCWYPVQHDIPLFNSTSSIQRLINVRLWPLTKLKRASLGWMYIVWVNKTTRYWKTTNINQWYGTTSLASCSCNQHMSLVLILWNVIAVDSASDVNCDCSEAIMLSSLRCMWLFIILWIIHKYRLKYKKVVIFLLLLDLTYCYDVACTDKNTAKTCLMTTWIRVIWCISAIFYAKLTFFTRKHDIPYKKYAFKNYYSSIAWCS